MESTGFAGFLGLDLFALFNCAASEPARVIELWPEGAPGEKGDIGPERVTGTWIVALLLPSDTDTFEATITGAAKLTPTVVLLAVKFPEGV